MKYPIVKRFYAVRPLQFMLEDPEGYYIVSYQEKCPITGRPTNDTFYMIIDSEYKDTDSIAYDSFELCKNVLSKRAMGNMDLIKQLTTEFNTLQRVLNEEKEDDI